jgi:hypothetical protein
VHPINDDGINSLDFTLVPDRIAGDPSFLIDKHSTTQRNKHPLLPEKLESAVNQPFSGIGIQPYRRAGHPGEPNSGLLTLEGSGVSLSFWRLLV